MAKTKDQKKEILENLIEKIKRAKSIIFARFNGLGVKENEELRKRLKDEKGEYHVVKKTLLDLAFKEYQIKDLNVKDFDGQIAAIFGFGDDVMPAKIVDQFKKDHKGKIEFVGGILENKFLSIAEVQVLAKLPSKQELFAKIVGSINAPISGLVNALAGNLKNLLYVFRAIEESKK